MTRIVHLEAGRHLFGGARQVLDLHAGLTEQGCDSLLVAPAHSDVHAAALRAGLPSTGVRMHGEADPSLVLRLARLLRRERPGILHVHSRRGGDLYGGVAARMAGWPAVLSRRVDRPERRLPGGLKYASYDAVVAISDLIAGQLRSAGVADDRIYVVRDAVSADDCRPTWTRQEFREEFGLREGQPCVAIAAQFIERKGHADALAAWPKVMARLPQARLVIFGRGPLEKEIVARARSMAGVTVAGFRDDLRRFLGQFDVFLHPARREGLGVVVLEAQAAGLPVVAIRAGGVPEIVQDGVTGILVPPGDVGALADAVTALLEDPDTRTTMGSAARSRVQADFSQDRMVEGNLAVYRAIRPGGDWHG